MNSTLQLCSGRNDDTQESVTEVIMRWTNDRIVVLLLLLLVTPRIVVADQKTEVSVPDEDEIFRELNIARTSPEIYARYLESQRQYYQDNKFMRPGEITIVTKEGVAAVNEAIIFLSSVTPVAPLTLSMGVSKAAADHVDDKSRTGKTGHKGSDNSQPWDRVNRYGTWSGRIGENLAFGSYTAKDVVVSLIVDDGVPGRGHRENIFEPDFLVVGIACGPHPEWRTICVTDFAQSYREGNPPGNLTR